VLKSQTETIAVARKESYVLEGKSSRKSKVEGEGTKERVTLKNWRSKIEI